MEGHMSKLEDLLARAVRELKVDVPVLRYEKSGDGLKLWLYGGDGKPVTWKPKAEKSTSTVKKSTPAAKKSSGSRPAAKKTAKKS